VGSVQRLSEESRDITALTGILGARAAWAMSADWGVWSPTLMLEWNHEFRDMLDGITAHFTHDPTATTITVGGEPSDSNYLRFGIGMSIVMAHGRSGFFLYDHTFAQDGRSQENLAIGIRIEF
jgi:outer membrane autotransporter protein